MVWVLVAPFGGSKRSMMVAGHLPEAGAGSADRRSNGASLLAALILLFAVFSVSGALATAAPAGPKPASLLPKQASAVQDIPKLIQPDALDSALKAGAKLLDIREDPEPPRPDVDLAQAESGTFREGHIAQSLNLPYPLWRGPVLNPGQPAAEPRLVQWMQALGLQRDDWVIVVYGGEDADDFAAAARVFWTLRYLGFDRLSILEGGVKRWLDENRPLVKGSATLPAASGFVPLIRSDLRVDRRQLEALIGQANLIDARPPSFHNGFMKHPKARRPGTLPGALSLEHDLWFDADGQLFPPETLRSIARRRGVQNVSPGGATTRSALSEPMVSVTFCNTGHWAATDWFVLAEILGVRNVKLYPESIVEWSRAGLPMANQPSRWQWLSRQWLSHWATLKAEFLAPFKAERSEPAGGRK